jgi:hypothetical protein
MSGWRGRKGVGRTRRIVRLKRKSPRSAMFLRARVENQFIRRHALIRHRASHIVRRTINNEIPEKRLALPESAVEGLGRV